MKKLFLIVSFVAMSSFFSCGGDEESDSECKAGETTTCTCADESLSSQTCGSDDSWGACVCDSPDVGPDVSGDVNEPEDEEMILIEAGSFTMGSPNIDSAPPHIVTLTHSFYLGRTEVTQLQWRIAMDSVPSLSPSCDDCPVENVNWYDAIAFANKLSADEGLVPCYIVEEIGDEDITVTANGGDVYACEGYRLPTEAEWEYAARAGTTTDFYNGDMTNESGEDPLLDDIAWYESNSNERTHTVAQKEVNPWGFYDMSGNVWEHTWDFFQDELDDDDVTDPTGPDSGSHHSVRGGAWNALPISAQSAFRYSTNPNNPYRTIGLRICRTAEE